jgi:uncharacterized CHY-type Zn-finger protein
MSQLFDRIDEKKGKDLKVLANFVSIFCREKHGAEDRDVFSMKDPRLTQVLGEEIMLCGDCRRLLSHAVAKSLQCPYDPKPMCKKCQTHCYAPGYREKIKEVMKFSGLYLVKHGRVDLMYHYLR